MTKCPVCGAIDRREDESGDGTIFLRCCNNHTFERRLAPRQWRAEVIRRMFQRQRYLERGKRDFVKGKNGKKGRMKYSSTLEHSTHSTLLPSYL